MLRNNIMLTSFRSSSEVDQAKLDNLKVSVSREDLIKPVVLETSENEGDTIM